MDQKKTDRLIEEIRQIAAGIDTVDFEITQKIDKGSVRCDPHVMQVIDRAAEAAGVTLVIMPSGAGHDANPIAHRLPIGMIFVPGKDCLSHCGEEWTEPADLENGVEVLYQAVLVLDCED